MSSNTMTLIEKLTGRDNYPTWKFSVKTYLEHEELWECVESSDKIDLKKDTKAKSKIILLVDPINYIHIQQAKTAKEVWDNLAKAFDDKGLTRRVGLLRDLITTTLDGCQNIEDYVNRIMSTAHKLRNIGFIVNDEWLGTLLLAGLPDVYQPMIMALESSGLEITADLVKTKLLQDIRKSANTALYVNKSKINSQNAKQTSDKANKGPSCFLCNRYGYISKNCRNNKKEQKSNENSGCVAVFSATTSNDDGWYVDSGASMHLTMHSDWLYDKIPPLIDTIKVADNKKLAVKACGKVNLHVIDRNGKSEVIKAHNVLYVPELATNLLSVSQIIKNGCHVQFDKQGCKIFNKMNKQVAEAKLTNNMYRLNTHSVPAYISTIKSNDPYLWHQRMAHLNFEDLNKLSESTGVKIENKDKVVCISCLEGKQSRNPFPSEGCRAKHLLELIHSDVCGPMEVQSLGVTIDLKEIHSNVTTRSRRKITKEGNSYLCTDGISDQKDVPQTYSEAISTDNESAEMWKQSINEELLAHRENKTWKLVDKPQGMRIIGCKWVFRIKDLPSGPLYKSRLCAKGYAQTKGVDYSETFSPTVRYDSI